LNNPVKNNKICYLLQALSVAAIISISCTRKVDTIKNSDILSLPSVTVRDDTTVYNDSGKVQLILTFPIMESYDKKDESYTEFKSGIRVDFYEGHEKPVGNVTAKYARFINKKNLWELKDSVIVVNESNDKLETEQLFWDQVKDIIYTDRFVKITSQDQIVMGSGFESDTKLTRRKIINYTATIYLHDE
jgi:LPS export ABC transporter protein LptC